MIAIIPIFSSYETSFSSITPYQNIKMVGIELFKLSHKYI